MLVPILVLTIVTLLAGGNEDSYPTSTRHVMTIVQQDPSAGPFDAPSARISGSGRHVVFSSCAQLVSADANQSRDIYVLDLSTGRLTLESVGPNGTTADGDSGSPDISSDGRYVVFVSAARGLTETHLTLGVPHVFLRDRQNATTTLLTTSVNGGPANAYSNHPAISADGTTVVFESAATDLIESTATAHGVGVYLIRPSSRVRVRLDVSSTGEVGTDQSVSPSVSADGRYVAFMSKAALTCAEPPACIREPPDTNGLADVYLRDTVTNTTTRVSRGRGEHDSNGPSYDPAISSNGRFVAFVSEASNLTADRSTHLGQIYLRDLVSELTELASHNPNGGSANGRSIHPAVSDDGSMISFQSLASDLLCPSSCRAVERDTNLVWDVYVHDRRTGRSVRASADAHGEEWMESSGAPSLDETGRVLVFGSRHPIGDRDDGHDEDLYVCFLRF